MHTNASAEGAVQNRDSITRYRSSEIVVKNSGDTFKDRDLLSHAACKLIAISRIRDRMARLLRGCRFLKPTHLDGGAVVGLQAGPLSRIAEGENYLDAYYELHRQVLGL